MDNASIIKPSEQSEMHFKASVIDGTALAIAEYLEKQFPEPSDDIKMCVFFTQEFYKLLCISVQTETEEEFIVELEKLFKWNKSN